MAGQKKTAGIVGSIRGVLGTGFNNEPSQLWATTTTTQGYRLGLFYYNAIVGHVDLQ